MMNKFFFEWIHIKIYTDDELTDITSTMASHREDPDILFATTQEQVTAAYSIVNKDFAKAVIAPPSDIVIKSGELHRMNGVNEVSGIEENPRELTSEELEDVSAPLLESFYRIAALVDFEDETHLFDLLREKETGSAPVSCLHIHDDVITAHVSGKNGLVYVVGDLIKEQEKAFSPFDRQENEIGNIIAELKKTIEYDRLIQVIFFKDKLLHGSSFTTPKDGQVNAAAEFEFPE